MDTTLLRIAYVRTFHPSEHLRNAVKHLFLHFGVSEVDIENGYLYLKVRVPCGDDVDALAEWERAQEIVYDAYLLVNEMMLPQRPALDHESFGIRWIPCKHR